MRLRRRPANPRAEPVVALVDVVFFLLVFFMLVARLDASAPFQVTPPTAVSGRDMPGGGVTLSVAADGALAVNGQAAGADWIDRVRRAALAEDVELIRVNADAATPLRHVLPLFTELEALELADVVLVVTPETGQ
ncbi:ExbD/TolR family protein [Ruegeria aquimaris]|uniref:Biopolymer transporter ExbD n=1 Tax=Ruegeria aquimaris TaxID=2984333 RepID=A0ABT3ANS8_9RHOB|nr:biopolymer transporter ExbD [Ruegeria sp. XHP0148]MCV2890314.1 biopolymer transporter ExbD [Ruegeria sp. XHP0148]